jgi:hypothetical protein
VQARHRRSRSGTVVMPERRMSSLVITVIAAGSHGQRLRALRHGRDLDLHQVFDVELEQVGVRVLRARAERNRDRDRRERDPVTLEESQEYG